MRTSTYGVRSFRSNTAKIWNYLPQMFCEITSAEQSRSQIGLWSVGSEHARSAQTVNAYVLFLLRLILNLSLIALF